MAACACSSRTGPRDGGLNFTQQVEAREAESSKRVSRVSRGKAPQGVVFDLARVALVVDDDVAPLEVIGPRACDIILEGIDRKVLEAHGADIAVEECLAVTLVGGFLEGHGIKNVCEQGPHHADYAEPDDRHGLLVVREVLLVVVAAVLDAVSSQWYAIGQQHEKKRGRRGE